MKAIRFVVAVGCALAAGSLFAQSGADVVKAKGCLGCHAVDQKKVGPSFKDIAAHPVLADQAAELDRANWRSAVSMPVGGHAR